MKQEEQRGRVAPNMGAGGSHPQATSGPRGEEAKERRKGTRGPRWADCEDDQGREEEEQETERERQQKAKDKKGQEKEKEKETRPEAGHKELTSERSPGLEQWMKSEQRTAQEAREEERRAQEAHEEQRRAQKALGQTKVQKEQERDRLRKARKK